MKIRATKNEKYALIVVLTATYPLDLTKTRLQIQGEANAVNGNAIDAVKRVNKLRIFPVEFIFPVWARTDQQ